MCGIGGFSLAKGSKIRPRELSNALLTALEDRGYMASGVAWHTDDGMSGVHKGATPGSGLGLKSMPKSVRTAIVHTRLATHGSVTDNRNNHPVMSPDEKIALVHNGVIYNHTYVRSILSKRIKFDVDTAVIPALIEEHAHDLESLRELDGDAAIAWLRDDEIGVLRLARLEHSPMMICQVADGSFIFASTEALLWKVLIKLDLMPDMMLNVDEYTHIKVVDGVILEMSKLGQSKHAGSGYNYGYYRNQTSGAKASGKQVWYDADYDDDEYWDYAISKANGAKRTDFYGATLHADPAYYIAFNAKMNKAAKPMFAYYSASQSENYEDDLELFHEYGDYELVDFGIILSDGTSLSDMTNDIVENDSALF